jgi:hypothetical protein
MNEICAPVNALVRKEVDMMRVMRCLVLFAALVTLFVVSPPGVRVVQATGNCWCGGYVYAYDYYPYYYYFEGQGNVSGNDYAAPDYGYCINFCNYVAVQAGASLCSQYNLGGGKGFVEPDYYWDFNDGTEYSAHVSGVQWAC